MYLDFNDLFMFVVLPVLGFIGIWQYWKQENKELYRRCSKAEDELAKYRHKEQELFHKNITDEVKSLPEIEYKEDIDTKHCKICNNTKDVKYFPTSGLQENNGEKTYFSGGVYLCTECLSKCEVCTECGKLIPFEQLQKYIGSLMKHPAFCEQLFAHKKVSEMKKKYGIK